MTDQPRPETETSITRRVLLGTAAAGGAALAAGILTTAPEVAAAPPPKGDDITRFSLAIDGTEIASFPELLDILQEIEVVDTNTDSGSDPVHSRFIGKTKATLVVLRRTLGTDPAIATWHNAAAQGDITARRDATLSAFNNAGTAIIRYNLANAWPTKLEVSPVTGRPGYYETVTFVTEQLQQVTA
jgi:phage tail-like protein